MPTNIKKIDTSSNTKVSKELISQQLGKKKGDLITDDTVLELNKLIEDPNYGEEFLDQYISYFDIVHQRSIWSTNKYMEAMKFFTLIEAGSSAVDAYVKVFPERLQSRLNRGGSKDDMGGEASRYNNTNKLVNEIRKVASIPVQLIHRHTLHKAINVTTELMLTARSEQVRQKAAETLIRELKPAEDSKIQLDISVGDRDAISDLRKATEQFAIAQLNSIKAGAAVKEMAEIGIMDVEVIGDE